MQGYFHTIPRLVATFVVKASPFGLIPNWITFITLMISAFCFSKIAQVQYRNIIPTDGIRVAASYAFCFLPSITGDGFGNLGNLHWSCFCWLAILALKNANEEFTPGEWLFFGLSCFTEGAALLLLPAFFRRSWTAGGGKRSTVKNWLPPSLILISAFINFLVRVPHNELAQVTPNLFLQTVSSAFYNFHLFEPLAGPFLTCRLSQYPMIYLGFSISVSFFIFLILLKKWLPPSWLLVEMGFVTLPIIILLVRPWTYHFFYGESLTTEMLSVHYGIPISFGGILFWILVIGLMEKSKRLMRFQKAAYIFFFFLHFTAEIHKSDFFIPPYDPAPSQWGLRASEIKSAITLGKPESIVIPIQPKGWNFNYFPERAERAY